MYRCSVDNQICAHFDACSAVVMRPLAKSKLSCSVVYSITFTALRLSCTSIARLRHSDETRLQKEADVAICKVVVCSTLYIVDIFRRRDIYSSVAGVIC